MKTFDRTEQREAREKGAGSHRYIITSFLLVFLLLGFGKESSALIGFSSGGGEIAWKGYQDGLAQARREGKPAIIIFYSDSCSACKRYKGVLRDKDVVAASEPFVMIRVNTRQQPGLSNNYQFDGNYIPRTFAVSPDGKIMHQLYRPKRYKYFIGLEPKNLLGLMQKAQAEIKR
ncbi:MAG: hypothetical protein D3908_15760 [Candidatus Electrothrix sp. AUS4]|nr:hypothetical protein [Candidatus Electrothrix sp. AUS4]